MQCIYQEVYDIYLIILQNQVQVCMTLEISPQHHAVVQGGSKMNLQHIRTITGTTIMFPDLTDPHIPPLRKNTISIRGSLDSVLQARLMLMVICFKFFFPFHFCFTKFLFV